MQRARKRTNALTRCEVEIATSALRPRP